MTTHRSLLGLPLLALLCLAGSSLRAQLLSVTPSSLEFGDVFTNAPQDLTLELQNNGSDPLEIRDVEIFHPAFQLSDTSFTLSASGTQTITVSFLPRHNIPHNTEIVIDAASMEGQIAVDVNGRGVYADSYYDPTQDLSGEALESALSTLISGHTALGYSPARDEMYMIIDNELVNGAGASQNRLVTAYTARAVEGYSSRSDAQTNYSVNTEHTWPQSFFSSADPMQSDIFHLYVTDQGANSTRGNLPFGNVTTPDWTDGGSKRGGGKFEPRDAQKGKTARSVLYFYLRYGNLGGFFTAAQETALVDWHISFPPDSVEVRRNGDIFSVQGNRNPLIDHPEFTERISSFLGTSLEPTVNSVDLVVESIEMPEVMIGESHTYDLVLVANGTEDIVISSWSLGDSQFDIATAPSIIEAGESVVLELEYTPTMATMIMDTLIIVNSSANASEIELPITASALASGLDEASAPHWNVWQQGSALQFQFPAIAAGTVQVYDISGKLNAFSSVDNVQSLRLPLDQTAVGWLTIVWKGQGFQYSRKVLWSL